MLAGGEAGLRQPPRGKDGLSMKLRRDLLDADSPAGIEVIQITTEPDVPWSHIYMEAQNDYERLIQER